MHYTNFTLRARDWEGGRFKVEVLNSPAGRMRTPVDARYDAAAIEPLVEQIQDTSARMRMTQGDVITLGQALAALLLPPAVKQMLLVSLGRIPEDEGLRVQLVLDDPEVARLPWEYLYLHEEDEATSLDGFLALNPRTPVVRHEAYSGGVVGATEVQGLLDVYVGFASPKDLRVLDLEAERGFIEAGLREALREDRRVRLRVREHLQVHHLETELKGAHVFHYAGHGAFYGEEAAKQKAASPGRRSPERAGDDPGRGVQIIEEPANDRVGVLFLEDEDGQQRVFPAPQLANTLRGAGVRVVVMDACKSAMRDAANVWTGIAPLLMRFGIPAAVGMQSSILDKAAISFSRLLYHALAAGMPLEEAVTHARIAIMNTEPVTVNGRSYEVKWDWGLPALYLRAENGIVFPALTENATLEPERSQAREGWLTFRQHVEEVEGDVWGVRVDEKIRAATKVAVEQELGILKAGAVVTGIEAETAEAGATAEVRQSAEKLEKGSKLIGGSFKTL